MKLIDKIITEDHFKPKNLSTRVKEKEIQDAKNLEKFNEVKKKIYNSETIDGKFIKNGFFVNDLLFKVIKNPSYTTISKILLNRNNTKIISNRDEQFLIFNMYNATSFPCVKNLTYPCKVEMILIDSPISYWDRLVFVITDNVENFKKAFIENSNIKDLSKKKSTFDKNFEKGSIKKRISNGTFIININQLLSVKMIRQFTIGKINRKDFTNLVQEKLNQIVPESEVFKISEYVGKTKWDKSTKSDNLEIQCYASFMLNEK